MKNLGHGLVELMLKESPDDLRAMIIIMVSKWGQMSVH